MQVAAAQAGAVQQHGTYAVPVTLAQAAQQQFECRGLRYRRQQVVGDGGGIGKTALRPLIDSGVHVAVAVDDVAAFDLDPEGGSVRVGADRQPRRRPPGSQLPVNQGR